MTEGQPGQGVTSDQVEGTLRGLYFTHIPRGAQGKAQVAISNVMDKVKDYVASGGISWAQKNAATADFDYQGQTWHFDVDNEHGWNLRE